MSTLADEVARLTKELKEAEEEIAGLKVDLEEAHAEGEAWLCALHDDEALENEVRVLRGFIEDVRLGIRDLSEYRDVCALAYP